MECIPVVHKPNLETLNCGFRGANQVSQVIKRQILTITRIPVTKENDKFFFLEKQKIYFQTYLGSETARRVFSRRSRLRCFIAKARVTGALSSGTSEIIRHLGGALLGNFQAKRSANTPARHAKTTTVTITDLDISDFLLKMIVEWSRRFSFGF